MLFFKYKIHNKKILIIFLIVLFYKKIQIITIFKYYNNYSFIELLGLKIKLWKKDYKLK